MEEHRVVVVGAGPAGIASALALKDAGVKPLVLDSADAVGASWRGRYDRLRLNSPRFFSHLPNRPFPKGTPMFPTRDQMVEHLQRHAGEDGIEVQLGTAVERIDANGGWTLRTSDGDVHSPQIVVATGYENFPLIPDWPGRETFSGELIHSSVYRNPSAFVGKKVLVVGPGCSGMEIAYDLAEGGATKVWLSARTPPNLLLRQGPGPIPGDVIAVVMMRLPVRFADGFARFGRRMDFGDLTEFGLPVPEEGVFARLNRLGVAPAIIDKEVIEAIKDGKIEVVRGVESLDPAGVTLADGARVDPDALIAATGFRRGLEPLVGHLGVLDDARETARRRRPGGRRRAALRRLRPEAGHDRPYGQGGRTDGEGDRPRAALAALREERAQEGGRLVGQEAGLDDGIVVERRLREHVHHAAGCARLGVGRAVDDVRNAGQDDRAGAHRAGLERDVERRQRQAPAPELGRGLAQDQDLGVGSGILAQLALVPRLRQDLAVPSEDRPDGDVPVGSRALGAAKRQEHQLPIAIGEGALAQVVRTMYTPHGAWWEILFGTLPSRKRRAPVIPLLPTTIRSAFVSSATSRIASAGSPSRACPVASIPDSRARPAAASMLAFTSSRGPTPCAMSPGTCCDSSRRRSCGTGSYALTMSRAAPVVLASSIAWETATAAVSEPSVPTTMRLNKNPPRPGICAAILTPMPRSWAISVAVLVVCLLASIAIAITKLA